MSKKATLLISLFTSVFLLSVIFYFKPPSFLSSTILTKPLSLFNHNRVNDAVSSTNIHHHHRHGLRSAKFSRAAATFNQIDVVVLTEKNFSDFVNENQYVMLNFYAPWCYWSQKLAPEYAAAATMVKASNKAVLAKIDAAHETELARKFKIAGYPTMYFLVGGVQKILYDFTEERTREAIANWVNQKINVAVQNLTTIEEAKDIVRAKSVIVLGFLENYEGQDSKELAAVSKMHIDVNFYQTSNGDVAKLFHIDEQIKRPALVILKREDINHTHFGYEGEFTRSSISDFVSTYKLPSVITFIPEDATNIFENPMKKLWLFTGARSWNVESIFKEAANAFKGKLLFVHVETWNGGSTERRLACEFGIPDCDSAPRIVAYHTENGDAEKHIYHGELTLSGIKSFAEKFLEGEFPSKLGSETKTGIRLPMHSQASDASSVPHAC
ncbi:hypothetical protein JCGZ_18539 [Jatropha curcas]|uniref:protein disulfide-isomerase n=1 Tax=Jatropha curcas TaxID=180498 RepID=A0A067L9K0_JATCU|nr:hypothetical protein JCGZ_18539 [Jatropha curcas]